MDRESEIGMGHILVTHARQTAVDFSKTTYTLELKLMVSKPKPLNSASNLLKPFQATLWALLMSTLLFTMVLLGMIKIMGNDKSHSIRNAMELGCLEIFGRFLGRVPIN